MDTSGGLGLSSTGRDRLARKLRRLRDLAGVSGRDLALRIGISQSKVSRIESGAVVPSLPEVTAWGTALGVSVETQARLTALTEAAYNEKHPWAAALLHSDLHTSIQDQESMATRILVSEPSVVPGLLQTTEYARCVIAMSHRQYSYHDPAAEVTSCLHRQLALYDSDRHFEFLITEAALRWRPGSTQLLLAQFDGISSIGRLDNVTVGLIPLSAEATTLTAQGFTLYESEEKDAWITVETMHGEMTVNAPQHQQIYRSCWSHLKETALFDEAAQEFLTGFSPNQHRIELPRSPFIINQRRKRRVTKTRFLPDTN
jgi:transcriptional regulator with XRE-family HTH domain